MTSLDRPACGHVRWGRSASQSTASKASAVMIGRKKSREYLIKVYGFNQIEKEHFRHVTLNMLTTYELAIDRVKKLKITTMRDF